MSNPFQSAKKITYTPAPIQMPEYTPPPEPELTPEAPTADSAAIEREKKRKRAEQAARSGRASTFLSDDEGSLG